MYDHEGNLLSERTRAMAEENQWSYKEAAKQNLDQIKLWEAVKKFIEDNEITCAETIYQTDWVAENSFEFMEKLCEIVGYKEIPDEN